MGDSCWFEISVKKIDEEILKKNFAPFSEYGANDQSEFKEQINFVFEEANYGFYSELENLSKTDLKFYGSHGAGGSYGPSEFVCNGINFLTVETGQEGGYVCDFAMDGNPHGNSLDNIKKYFKMVNEVEKYFKENLYPTLAKQ